MKVLSKIRCKGAFAEGKLVVIKGYFTDSREKHSSKRHCRAVLQRQTVH
jgi:hypothetical protein